MDGSSGLPPAGAGSVGGVSKGLASPSSASSASAAAPSADKILREVMHKITQIVVRARIPAHADLEKSSPLNKWFNMQLAEWAGVRGELDILLRTGSGGGAADGSGSASSSALFNPSGSGSGSASITAPFPSSSSSGVTGALIQLDVLLRNSRNYNQHVLLERWNIQHERHSGGGGSSSSSTSSASKKADPASMYKKLLLLVRSVYLFVKLLPAYAAWQSAQKALQEKQTSAFAIGHQLSSSERSLQALLAAGLASGSSHGAPVLSPSFDVAPRLFTFHAVATPAGRFTLSVLYRPDLAAIDFLVAAGVALGPRSALPAVAGSASAAGGHVRGASAASVGQSSAQQQLGGPSHPHPSLTASPDPHQLVVTAGSEQIIISDYMSAPETNRPNPAHMIAAASQTRENADILHQQQHAYAQTQQAQTQQQQQQSQSHPPKSALALELEQQRRKRESGGDGSAYTAEQLQQQQQYQQQQQAALGLDPRLSDRDRDRRHTLPPNQPLFPAGYDAAMSAHAAVPGPRTERAASVHHNSSYGSGVGGISHSLPRDGLSMPHARRMDSDGSDSSALHGSGATSRPMSIPRGAPAFQQQQQQQGPFVPQSMPAATHTHALQAAAAQQHQHHHHGSHSGQQSAPPLQQSSSHSPHSHSPSFNNTYGTSVGTPHSYGSLGGGGVGGGGGGGAGGLTAYSPFNTSGTYLPGHAQTPSAGHVPFSSSSNNLEKLLEESPEEEEQRFSQTDQPYQQQQHRGMYDAAPSGAYSQQQQQQPRLPHSYSQPMGLSPQLRAAAGHGASISSSGSLPLPIPASVPSPSSNTFVNPSSRKNSGVYGTSADAALYAYGGAQGSSNNSPLSASYKGPAAAQGIGAAKPPLPSPSPSYAPFSASSRVTTSTSTFSSPLLGPQPAPGSAAAVAAAAAAAGGSAPPAAASSASSSSPSGSLVIRERDAGFSGGRFSGLGAAQALPPPKLGSSTPSPSGLSRALNMQQHQQGQAAHSYEGQQGQQGSSSPPMSVQDRSAGGSRVHSPSSSPTIGLGTSPSSSSRPISIPAPRGGHGHGSGSGGGSVSGSMQFGRTPPFVGAGSETTLGLMQRQSASAAAQGFMASPTNPSMMGALESGGGAAGAGTSVGVGTPHRGSATWLQGTDLLGSSAGAQPYQFTVPPFKATLPGRKGSVSGASPVLTATPNTPAQRVVIVPQLPAFDLRGPAPSPASAHQHSQSQSQQQQVSGSALAPFDATAALGDDEDLGDGGGEDALSNFHQYVSGLQQSSSHGPALQLFAAPESSSASALAVPSSSDGAQRFSVSASPTLSGSQSQSQLGGGGGVRLTNVQSLFDQLDKLQLASTAHASQSQQLSHAQ